MVSVGSYILSGLLLAVIGGSVGFSAFRLRRHLLPAWDGAPARLVETVLAVALLIWLCELLGLFWLLYPSALVIESLLVAGAILLWSIGEAPEERELDRGAGTGEGAKGFPGEHGREAPGAPPAPTVPRGMTAVALAVVFVVFAHWGIYAKGALESGIVNWDSLSFHMPFAADFAQTRSVTGYSFIQPVFPNWFYPQNSELLHSAGILLTGRDTLSLFVNFGWLGLGLLAAWCAGRPFGRGPLTLAAAAILLDCNTYLLREPGSAKNDVMEVALVLAAVALLINAWEARRRRTATDDANVNAEAGAGSVSEPRALPVGWPLAAAGLAAGLALGTRVTVIAVIAALSVPVLILATRPARARAAAFWFLPLLAGGGYWYLRNFVATGNPMPVVKGLGPIPLPHPEIVQSGLPNFSVAHYATDTTLWSDYFGPGLEYSFGEVWPLVVIGALAGALVAVVWGRNRLLRWVGAAALFGVLAYLFTPAGAGGLQGAPTLFAINTRFAIPALAIGIVLAPLARGLEAVERRWALLVGLVLVFVLTDEVEALLHSSHVGFGLLVGLIALTVPLLALAARHWHVPGREALAAGLAVVALPLVVAGYSLQRDYLRDRYSAGIPWAELDASYHWAEGVSNARIGLTGTTAGTLQYGYYGPDLSNRVVYLGEHGPHDAFNPIPDCAAFHEAVNDANLDYLVTSPFLNYVRLSEPIESPEARWLRGSEAVEAIETSAGVTVWRVLARLDPAACGRENAPLQEVPRQPET
jgi:hypothetical protein